MKDINIDISILDKLFPFSFVVNKEGVILGGGSSFKKLTVDSKSARTFNDLFEVCRPANSSFSTLFESARGEMIIIRMRNPKAEFMGQILDIDREQNLAIFVMNLVVQNADELNALNLDFNDFAIQDPIFDYLMLLQTQQRAIRHADELNKKLTAAHEVAVKASQAKSQFLANMSHELRTPMNGVLSMASVLLETSLDEDQKDFVQTLMQSGEAMLGLINDILDLSKIEAGFIELNEKPFSIRDLIQGVSNTVQVLAQKKKLDLQVSIADAVPMEMLGDYDRLRQVVLNLVGNAVKFTEHGFVNVTCAVTEGQLTVKVRDSGIGMNKETLGQIFSPFVQGDSSMTKKFEGTGLGLSICKKLIEAMNGQISVSSQEGKGSEFTVSLPLAG